ncbi:MAG: hypothetical protein K5984_00510 [Bacteroidales bacterium]|nr:hypothetical protein [Bacteroidales bacterium]
MKRYITLLLLVFVSGMSLFAQGDRILVGGTIVNKATGKPVDMNSTYVEILSFDTPAQAQDCMDRLKNGEDSQTLAAQITCFASTVPYSNAYYEIKVAPFGALVFKVGLGNDNIQMHLVNNRSAYDHPIEVNTVLDGAKVTAKFSRVSAIPPQGIIDGDLWTVSSGIQTPCDSSKSWCRMIVQPILIESLTRDTVSFLRPFVVDGKQYALTQLRRQDYKMEANDPLTDYIRQGVNLERQAQTFAWKDSIRLKDPNKEYTVLGVVQFENYKYIYRHKTLVFSTARNRRPTKFIEPVGGPYALDPDDYKEAPRKVQHDVSAEMSLTFKIGKAEFDDANPQNKASLDALKEDLYRVTHEEGSHLNEFVIECTSSPDGNYSRNLELSRRRMASAQKTIKNFLPEYLRDRVYWRTPKVNVASWNEVADLLESEGENEVAAKVRKVVSENPGRQDRQSYLVKKLDEYRDVVVPVLPQLRKVRYEYVQEVFREYSPSEIMRKYNSGVRKFEPYEYWTLFQEVKDTAALERLYRDANEEYKALYGKPWILPSNALACLYLERGQVDTTLLAPFIDYNLTHSDLSIYNQNTRKYDIYNPSPVVANQLMMFLANKSYPEASVLAQMLPDNDDYQLARALALCYRGYYQGGNSFQDKARNRRVFEIIEASSPLNEVVINLALKTAAGNAAASAAIDEEETISYFEKKGKMGLWNYLKAVVATREAQETLSGEAAFSVAVFLLKSFQIDPVYMDYAAVDGDLEKADYEEAKKMYDEWKGGNENE